MSDNPIDRKDLERTLKLSIGSKSVILAYILWFFLGMFGAHRFYLGKTGSGVAMLLLSLFGWLTSPILIGFIPLLIVGIWWLLDAVLLFFATQSVNRKVDDIISKL